MAIRLLLTDIDGTVLPRGAERVSERLVRAMRAAVDAGMLVGPCSGRGYSWVQPFFWNDPACYATCVATNGLQVYLGGECVLQKTLPADGLARMLDVVRSTLRAGMLVFDGALPLLVHGDRDDLARVFPAYGASCKRVDSLPDFPVIKANVFTGGSPEDSVALVGRINAEVASLDVDHAMSCFSNVMPRGWNKGAAIRWLCEREGIAPEEVVAFGDANNDLSMFAAVPNSVAVAGATPDAAAAARWHIGRCEDDAVAAAIERIVAGAELCDAARPTQPVSCS